LLSFTRLSTAGINCFFVASGCSDAMRSAFFCTAAFASHQWLPENLGRHSAGQMQNPKRLELGGIEAAEGG
jgi:hypothetical protein